MSDCICHVNVVVSCFCLFLVVVFCVFFGCFFYIYMYMLRLLLEATW